MKKIILSIVFTCIFYVLFSQTYTIDGNAFLENETNHSGINIVLNRTAPSNITYTLSTDNTGAFSETIEEGIYNITYSKDGYVSQNLTDIYVYDNVHLDDLTLLSIGISGNLSGTLEAGTYSIGADVTVPSGEVLIIEPGAKLCFRENVKLLVNGQLIANGTSADSIVFTQKDDGVRWGGIHLFSHLDNQISYSIIEYSGKGGVIIDHSDATIHHSQISQNSNTESGYGGGISIENGNAILYNLSIFNNTTSNGGGISIVTHNNNVEIANCIIFNNTAAYMGGGILTSAYLSETVPTVSNSVIYNNSTGSANSGSIHEYHCSSNYINNIIYDNNRYGIYFSDDDIQNSYVAHNNIYGNASGNFYNTPDLIGEIITTNANGDQCDAYHNIHEDPMFVNANANDFHLLEGSPCIDVGVNDYAYHNFDLDDNVRIWSGTDSETQIIDIGPYEYGAPTEISLIEKISTINVFPNPANEIININSNRINLDEIIITDILGKVVLTKQNPAQNQAIDISHLKTGVYIVMLQANNVTHRKKIVKK